MPIWENIVYWNSLKFWCCPTFMLYCIQKWNAFQNVIFVFYFLFSESRLGWILLVHYRITLNEASTGWRSYFHFDWNVHTSQCGTEWIMSRVRRRRRLVLLGSCMQPVPRDVVWENRTLCIRTLLIADNGSHCTIDSN